MTAKTDARKRFLVIAKNADGRPCAWAKGQNLNATKENAEQRFAAHCCYPGEKRGATEVHLVHEDGSITPHIGKEH